MKAFFRELIITAVLALVVFFALRFTIDTVIIIGISMEPSFHSGQRILISKVTYRMHEPERGDVIVFRPTNSEKGEFIKRIIAVPNDTVEVKDDAVYVNGTRLKEPYINNTPSYHLGKQKIPAGNYFVLGDNRNQSNDSHNGWVVPRQNIVGKAWLSIWPPPEWGLVPEYSLHEQLASVINTYMAKCYLLYNM
ncbi:MAG: signal peptidase I [Dehalococcoidia bacterium]|nr:signal peptidase I [Dehalococcoidia bacterium]